MRSCTLTEVKPVPIGVVTGPLSADAVAHDRVQDLLRQGVAVFLECRRAGKMRFPLELRPGRRDHAQRRRGDLGADTVAGKQCDGFHDASGTDSIEGAAARLSPPGGRHLTGAAG